MDEKIHFPRPPVYQRDSWGLNTPDAGRRSGRVP